MRSAPIGLPTTNEEGLTLRQMVAKCKDEAARRWNRRVSDG